MKIACDESGFTGPDLLASDQRHFSFASVNLSDDEAWEIIKQARDKHPVQMPELKASKLMGSNQGRQLITHIVESISGKFAVNLHDKLLALCGWVFEYVFEPVYQKNLRIFYEKEFHLFVAMYCYIWFLDSGSEAKKVLSEFQEMMRTKNVSSAPSLFTFRDTFDGGRPHPFELIRRFATANLKIIAKEVSEVQHQLSDGGTWALDLSISGLWSHLNHWVQKNEPLKVLCDESKPIRAMSGDLSGDKNDAAIRRAQNLMPGEPLGWETAEPIRFVDSRAHPSVQLADVIASTVVHSRPNGTHSDFKAAAEILDEGMLRDSIVPNFKRVKLDKDPAKVHYAVLHEIVLRSEGKGTKVSIEDYFKIVEDTVKFGDFSI